MTRSASLPADPGVHSFAPNATSTRTLRDAFGRFGTGVTVITTQTDAGPLGITANSFSAISLEPALVLWSPARASGRYPPFAAAETFCIHVLAANQADLASHFAKTGNGFEAFDWAPGPVGAPTLPGCLAEFHCTTYAHNPAGDHALILGEIKEARLSLCDRPGLLFERSGFGQFSALAPQ
jgi:flavin reductase (DIM6/NTAB) family NADH-FMN oxidoreductase RutF